MNILASLQQRFGFTRNEVKVTLFLSATFLIGLGIRSFESATRNDTVPRFDYASVDSEFTALSLAPATAAAATNPSPSHAVRPKKPALREGSVDVNSAGAAELVLLPGIGPSYAERIIAYRTVHGPFTSVDELMKVKGIGKKRLEQIRKYIKLSIVN